ncbi:MAG: response regulator [Geminicoccaceae bacterium]|nr:response regulator [Geminicoccaceae bacterium]
MPDPFPGETLKRKTDKAFLHALLLEDDVMFARILRRLIENIDDAIVVDHATTLEEAKRKLVDTVYDIAIVDLNLPDAFSDTSTRFLNEVPVKVPLMVLSGSEDDVQASIERHPRIHYQLVKSELDEDAFRLAFLATLADRKVLKSKSFFDRGRAID